MRETFTAMLPVAGGGATFYQATGPFATEIIQRIANIAGLKSVDSMPDDAFGCRFTEIQREEAEKSGRQQGPHRRPADRKSETPLT